MNQPNDKAPRPSHDDALLGPLVRAAHAAPAAGSCPDAETLALHAEQALAGDERTGVLAHVASCGRCQEALAAYVRGMPEAALAPASRVEAPWWSGWRWMVPLATSAAVVVMALWVWPRNDVVMHEADRVAPATASVPAPGIQAEWRGQPSAPPAAIADRVMEARTAQASPQQKAPTSGTFDNRGSATAPRQSPRDADETEGARAAAGAATVTPPAAPAVSAAVVDATGRADAETAQKAAAVQDARARSEVAPVDQGTALGRVADAREATAFRALAAPPVSAPSGANVAGSANAVSNLNAWRLRDGMVERTHDDGTTWRLATLPAGVRPIAIASPSRFVCWVVGARAVARTTDGTTWTRVSAPSHEDLRDISATDGQHAVVTTAAGIAFATRDGGATWRPMP